MNPGSVVEAEVTAVETYGVYLVCEGRKVLVLNGELAWLPNASDFAAIGSRHQVRLLRFVPDTELFLASFKQVHPEQDPWRDASRFAIGSVRPATVTKLVHRGDQPTLCGRLLELEPGVAGYLPAADSGPEPSLGAVVRVRIVRVDAASQQIELVAAGE